jgi:hypothetical protein
VIGARPPLPRWCPPTSIPIVRNLTYFLSFYDFLPSLKKTYPETLREMSINA